jgi:hypothetical protein
MGRKALSEDEKKERRKTSTQKANLKYQKTNKYKEYKNNYEKNKRLKTYFGKVIKKYLPENIEDMEDVDYSVLLFISALTDIDNLNEAKRFVYEFENNIIDI